MSDTIRHNTLPIRYFTICEFITSNIIDSTQRSHGIAAYYYTHIIVMTGAPTALVRIRYAWFTNSFEYWLPANRFCHVMVAIPTTETLTFSWQVVAGSTAGTDIRIFGVYSPNSPEFNFFVYG